jgi:hypothetical protein
MNRSGIYALVSLFLLISIGETVLAQEKTVRYILIEAPCKPAFPAPPSGKNKVIITKVFKVQYESPFELVSAEPELISRFEVALEKAFPGSRNQIKDILVYMLVTEKEARELYNRKSKQFKLQEIAAIELKTE